MVRMRLAIRSILWARFVILAWAIIWFTTVPLFHTHLPDTDRQASQGGVAHTVFSPDLPGEFTRFSIIHYGPFSQLSNRVSNSPELGFIFSAWQVTAPDVLEVGTLLDAPFLSTSVNAPHAARCKSLLLPTSSSPRAPPSVMSA